MKTISIITLAVMLAGCSKQPQLDWHRYQSDRSFVTGENYDRMALTVQSHGWKLLGPSGQYPDDRYDWG